MTRVVGILFVIVGVMSLFKVIKSPIKNDEAFLNSANIQWYGFSVGLILIGIYLISD